MASLRVGILFVFFPLSALAADVFTNPTPADAPVLVTHLRDASLRQGAVNALVRIGEPAAPPLVASLASDDLDAVIWSAYALGKIGPSAASAAKPLTVALQSPDRDLRAVAARSLGQIRATEASAIVALAAALKDDDARVCRHAAVALGAISPPAREAAPNLIAALKNESARVPAREALKQIGAPAVPALKTALADDAVRLDAAEALRAIDPAAAREAGVDTTSLADLAALAMSVSNADRETATRIEHLNCLARLGVEAAPSLINVFGDASIEVSRAASGAFSQMGVVGLPKLQEALQDEFPRVRSAAADAIAAIGPDARPAIADLAKLLSDSDRGVRYRAAAALDHLGPVAADAAPALIECMNNVREQEATRQMAIKALAQTGPATRDVVLKALREVNDQGNFGVRSLAEDALKQVKRHTRDGS